MSIATGLGNIRQETTAFFASAANRECKNQRQQQHPNRIISVEQLERPLLAGEFLGVCPGSPAQHGYNRQSDGERVGLDNQHG
jgi:hypothetical protein